MRATACSGRKSGRGPRYRPLGRNGRAQRRMRRYRRKIGDPDQGLPWRPGVWEPEPLSGRRSQEFGQCPSLAPPSSRRCRSAAAGCRCARSSWRSVVAVVVADCRSPGSGTALCGAIGEKIGDPDQGLPSNDRSLFNLEFLVQSACEATISDMARQDEPRRIASPASAWRFLRLLAPSTRRSDAVDLMPAVVRGTRLHLPRHDIPRRFIPARAGNA